MRTASFGRSPRACRPSSLQALCNQGRYRIEKLVLSDPRRDVVLQRVTFQAFAGAATDYRLYALLAPHLVNKGAGNTAWIDDYKGVSMLFAEGERNDARRWLLDSVRRALGRLRRGLGRLAGSAATFRAALALRCRAERQCRADRRSRTWQSAVAAFVLALGFGRTAAEAALRVHISLNEDVDAALSEYVAGWRAWQDTLLPLDPAGHSEGHNTYRVSTAVLRAHEARSFAGGYIASLSVPWGFAKGDDDLGGYHLVWPRDLVETAGGLLAVRAKSEVRQVIDYLQGIQEADGHWPQNCWLDGTPYWNGVQLDECAFPILLVDLALREGVLPQAELRRLWPMITRAAGYIVRNGPVTGQDRWEEDGGYSPFTLAVEIAALLAAADFADGSLHRA